MSIDPAGGNWHLDKRIPVALIGTLVIQAAAVVWWGSELTSRVEAVERQVSNLDDSRERLIRLEEQSKLQTVMLSDIRQELKERK